MSLEISPQAPRLFNLYNLYKVIIGLLLLGMTFTNVALLKEYRSPDGFQTVTLLYVLLNLSILAINRTSQAPNPKHVLIAVSLDILFLHGLFYCGKGIEDGLTNLAVITVAAGNIIIRGRIGLSFAALASLVSLAIEIERFLQGPDLSGNIVRAGLMGSVYFATAYILQNLSLRISQSESLAEEQKQNIIELQKLNHLIIQSMRTGIIVCDDFFHIKTLNQACQNLLGLKKGDALPQQVIDRIELWRLNPSMRTTPFQIDTEKPMVQANFSHLETGKHSEILIFIDDTRLMSQQAQQLKLASLGRLTASIAHEIRNPLGAISHATQLLAESTNLDPADRKMTDIIQRHSKRVNMIVENTLQLSRRAEPNAEEINLKNWLQKVVEDYEVHLGETKAVQIVISQDDAHARFDPDQIEQVLVNLLDNGLRHSRKLNPKAVVKIKLCEATNEGQAYIDIIDEGAGISAENAAHLFEPFFTTENQGTGLGLYLSREICEANQARLDYIHDHQEGTCFRLSFAHHKRII